MSRKGYQGAVAEELREANEELEKAFVENPDVAHLARILISTLQCHFRERWHDLPATEVSLELLSWADARGLIREKDVAILGEAYAKMKERQRPI